MRARPCVCGGDSYLGKFAASWRGALHRLQYAFSVRGGGGGEGGRRLLTSGYLSVCSSWSNSRLLSPPPPSPSPPCINNRTETQVRLRRLSVAASPRCVCVAPVSKRHRAIKTVYKLFQLTKASLFPLTSVFLRALFSKQRLSISDSGAIPCKVKGNQSRDLNRSSCHQRLKFCPSLNYFCSSIFREGFFFFLAFL